MTRTLATESYPDIVDDTFRGIVNRWLDTTLLSVERLWSLYEAVRHVARAGLPGAIVECGTYKGGSTGVMLETLVSLGVTDREIHLFDTFDGFPEGVDEILIDGSRFRREDWPVENFRADLEANLARTGYPRDRIHVVSGQVEKTIPAGAPPQIALLHLDTDYYGATLHQLEHLFPRLRPGGVIQVDDFGHFLGCRRAVEEYFARPGVAAPLFARIDYTGRLGVKPGG